MNGNRLFCKGTILLIMVLFLCIPSFAYNFKYTYEGKTLLYEVIDDENKTCSVFSNANGVYALGDLIIPETAIDEENAREYTVVAIGSRAFERCEYLNSVIVPRTVKSIGSEAFKECRQLISVTLPDSVESIGNWAFWGCGSLDLITLPDSVKAIGESAFANSGLDAITLPAYLTAISNNLFEDCDGLMSVTMGNNITSIGERAFYGCICLESITIPNSVTSIGKDVFGRRQDNEFYFPPALKTVNTNSIEAWLKINFDGETANPIYYTKSLTLNGETLTDLHVPEGTEKILPYAFTHCQSLESVTLPNGLREIGIDAFAVSNVYQNLTIPESMEIIEAGALPICNSVRFDGVPKVIRLQNFNGKSQEMYIADANKWCGVNSVDPVVSNSGSLYVEDTKAVNLELKPESGIVNFGCFQNAPVEKVRVAAELIKAYAFKGSSMSALCLDVKTISNEAFSMCENLRDVYSLTPEPPAAWDKVFDDYSKLKLYVPVGSKEKYKNSPHCWRLFPELIETDFAGIDAMFRANYGTSGVDEPVKDNISEFDSDAPYEIYNLNGLRISANDSLDLAPGIYILRQGSQVKKIAVK